MKRLDSIEGPPAKRRIRVDSPDQTLELGRRFGNLVPAGAVVSLEGGLGAGKTFLIKGISRGLGIETEVLSPTFILVEEYRGDLPFMHFDLYRLDDLEEVERIGLYDAIDGCNVVFVEWGDRLPEGTVEFDIRIHIEIAGENAREIEIVASKFFIKCLLEEPL